MTTTKIKQPDLFELSALSIARQNADKLSAEFLIWLPDNLHIWDAFVEQTLQIIKRGFKHYSSYTIIEFLRHHSMVKEGHSEWKINNNVRPYLPRLFDLVYPQHVGLWEFRATTKKTGK
jgi:hypothetical protein